MAAEYTEEVQTYIEHLKHFIQFPTVSDENDLNIDFRPFMDFHRYLQKTYPVLHRKFKKEVIGKANLLYHYSSAHPSGKLPVLLMAHQDVVPVGETEGWSDDPFSGNVHDGAIWGRGATDCKNVILSELEAVEHLFTEGFDPDFDIYLAYSYNEEVQSRNKGAEAIVETLYERDIHLGAVFDEGSGPSRSETDEYKSIVNIISLGEKASQDYEIYAESEGGHSMAPGRGTALGRVAAAVAKLEAEPFPYRLIPLVKEELRSKAKQYSGHIREIYEEPEKYFDELIDLSKTDKLLDSHLHTTIAITQAYGSERSNILPTRAGFIVNVRLLEGDNEETVIKHFREVLPEDIKIKKLSGDNPTKSTLPKGREYDLIQKAVSKVYDVSEESVITIPSYLAGGTDSRYYRRISDNVFIYSGIFHDGKSGGAHGYNEHFSISNIDTGIRFFTEYLKLY